MTTDSTEQMVLGSDEVARSITRIAHEIVERNGELSELVILGLQTGGCWISDSLVSSISEITGGPAPRHGTLDVSMYRDDIGLRPLTPVAPTSIPGDLTGSTVVLVDDVLYTGRTVRAAMEALNDHGRPKRVRLVVMVDRGHRELPIRPDHVGKNLPTHVDDEVSVSPDGVRLIPRSTRG